MEYRSKGQGRINRVELVDVSGTYLKQLESFADRVIANTEIQHDSSAAYNVRIVEKIYLMNHDEVS